MVPYSSSILVTPHDCSLLPVIRKIEERGEHGERIAHRVHGGHLLLGAAEVLLGRLPPAGEGAILPDLDVRPDCQP